MGTASGIPKAFYINISNVKWASSLYPFLLIDGQKEFLVVAHIHGGDIILGYFITPIMVGILKLITMSYDQCHKKRKITLCSLI